MGVACVEIMFVVIVSFEAALQYVFTNIMIVLTKKVNKQACY